MSRQHENRKGEYNKAHKKTLSRNELKSSLSALHTKMPSKPTAVKDLYKIPPAFADRYNNSDDRRPLIQELADHMRFYLGVLEPIHVKIVNDFCGSFNFAINNKGIAFPEVRHPFAGLYSGRRMITIANEQRYSFPNMCAILAHECTHNYMDIHKIRNQNIDQEILTDLTAVYLGFGFILMEGYETYNMSIGYLSNKSIKEAILQSSKKRGWSALILSKGFESGFEN